MAVTDVSNRRSNKDLARVMTIGGIAVVVVAAALDIFGLDVVHVIDGLGPTPRDLVYNVWLLVTRLGYAFGPLLIVGAIIVNRLPEREES